MAVHVIVVTGVGVDVQPGVHARGIEEDVAARVKELAPGGCHVIVEVNTENLRIDLSAVAPGGNIAIYVGGMFEIGVGRRQLGDLASVLCPDAPNDLAPVPLAEATTTP